MKRNIDGKWIRITESERGVLGRGCVLAGAEERTLQAAHMGTPDLGTRSGGPWACLGLKSRLHSY